MCGIFGQVNPSRIDPIVVRRGLQKIRHRGPDDEGYVLANTNTCVARPYGGDDTDHGMNLPNISIAEHLTFNLAFGFRRLSILDLSTAGHQPMASADGKLWIVFNGEIYNYVELRNELSRLGHTFCSSGDTEVILAAYSQWGSSCLRRFVGMWAFAILDFRRSCRAAGERPIRHQASLLQLAQWNVELQFRDQGSIGGSRYSTERRRSSRERLSAPRTYRS